MNDTCHLIARIVQAHLPPERTIYKIGISTNKREAEKSKTEHDAHRFVGRRGVIDGDAVVGIQRGKKQLGIKLYGYNYQQKGKCER